MKDFFQAFRPILADFVSTIVFVALYAITGSIYAAIPLGVAAGILQIAWLKYRGTPASTMQWASLALVIVLGGASLFTHDARFVMIKPSIGTIAIGCVMLSSNWLDRYLPAIVKQNVSEAFTRGWSRGWGLYLFLLAGANLYVAFAMGPKAWAWFNGIVPMVSQIGLFLIQYGITRIVVRRRIVARIASGEQPDLVLAELYQTSTAMPVPNTSSERAI
ncbi:MAG TPA: septation protein IspZ [Rhizomicrobium sp.]|jgi:intracellular septation protein A